MTNADLYSFRRGTWFGVFGDNLIVLLPPSEKSRVAGLWELVDGGSSFDETLDALIASGLRDLPGFVLVARASDAQTKVVLRGAGSARFATTAGEVVVDGTAASTWVEQTIDSVTAATIEVETSADDTEFFIPGGLVRVSQVVTGAHRDSSGPSSGGSAAAVALEDSDPALSDPIGSESTGSGEVPSAVGPSEAEDAEPAPEPEPEPAFEPPVGAPMASPPMPPVAEPPIPAPPAPAPPAPAPPASEPPAPEPPVAEPVPEPLAPAPPVAEPAPEPPAWGPPQSAGAPALTPEPPGLVDSVPSGAPQVPPVWAPSGSSAQVPPPFSEPGVHDGSLEHDGLTSAPGALGSSPEAQGLSSPLGQSVAKLVFSSGETIDVDRAIIIGRAPEARRFTSSEQPRLVTVPSPHQEISSTHLEIRPGAGADHGTAVVTDMGSTNGTVLVQPGLTPEDMRAGVAVQLIPGAIIDLGDGVTIQVTQP